MNTPRPIAANQRPAGPRSVAGKAASPCHLPQNPIPGHPWRPPPEAKANFVQPQSAQQKIGFFRKLPPTPWKHVGWLLENTLAIPGSGEGLAASKTGRVHPVCRAVARDDG